MRRVISLVLFGFAGASTAVAAPGAPCPIEREAACMMDTIWAAADVLPSQKRARLNQPMLRLAKASGDAALLADWEARLGEPTRDAPVYHSYARQKADEALKEAGWAGFIARAESRAPPFNIGRPEIMGAGVRMADTPERAKELMDLMFTLARPNLSRGGRGDTFEQADFGHILSELAMERCDLVAFDRATALTFKPDALRYSLWRARITGERAELGLRILQEADETDTRHVRQAIEGYTAIVKRGYCKRSDVFERKEYLSEPLPLPMR